MENLEWLCSCCKNNNCSSKEILIRNTNNCKIIKCLRFVKDDQKIKKPSKFEYVIRSDNQ